MTRPTVVLMTMPGVNSFSPSPLSFLWAGQAELDHRVDADLLLGEGQEDLVGRREERLMPSRLSRRARRGADRQVVRPHDDVLGRADDRVAVGGAEDVVGRHHQRHRLDLRLDRERQVDGHLVAVEVGVEALADERVDADRVAFDQDRLERLDTHAVQGRGRFRRTGWLWITSSRMSQTSSTFRSSIFLADLIVSAWPSSLSRRMMNGWNSSSAIFLGRPHWCSLRSGPTTITERAE